MNGIQRTALLSTTSLAGLIGAAILIAGPSPAYADCTPTPTAGDDTIVCTGTSTGDIDTLAGNDSVDNSGTIDGNVVLGVGDDMLSNSGSILGDVDLGDGSNIFETSGAGTVLGTVTGGDFGSQFNIVDAGDFVYDFSKYLGFTDIVQTGTGSLTVTGSSYVQGLQSQVGTLLTNGTLSLNYLRLDGATLTVDTNAVLNLLGTEAGFVGNDNGFVNNGFVTGVSSFSLVNFSSAVGTITFENTGSITYTGSDLGNGILAGNNSLVTNDGTISVTVNDSLGMNARTTIGIYVGDNSSVTNNGSLQVTGLDHDGIGVGVHIKAIFAEGTIGNTDITNNGVIEAFSQAENAYGVEAVFARQILNTGTIDVTTNKKNAYGINTVSTVEILNTGTIEVTANGDTAWGILAGSGGNITNSGTINVTGTPPFNGEPSGIGIGSSYLADGQTSDIVNSGSITAYSTDMLNDVSVGILVKESNGTTNITNTLSGSITAATAIQGQGDGTVLIVGTENVENSGVITGLIDLGLGNDSVSNSGQIFGDIHLGDGDDIVTNSASITGDIYTGDGGGNDQVTNTGAIFGNLVLGNSTVNVDNSGEITGNITGQFSTYTVVNSGTITGDIDLGSGTKTLANSGTITGSVNLGNLAILQNTGLIDGSVFFGSGSNTLNFSDIGEVTGFIDGGSDNDDTLVLDVDAETLVTLRDITGFEFLDNPNSVDVILNGTVGISTIHVQGFDLVLDGDFTGNLSVYGSNSIRANGIINGDVQNSSVFEVDGRNGTLRINGDYRQTVGATVLRVGVYELSLSSPTIAITGEVFLDGDLELTLHFSSTELVPGETYRFLSAGAGVTGEFANVTLNTSQFLAGTLIYTNHGLEIGLVRSSFLLPFFSSGRGAIARQLDAMAAAQAHGAAGDFIQALTFTERRLGGYAIDQLASQAAADLPTPVIEARHGLLSHVSDRLVALGNYRGIEGRWVTSVTGFGEFGDTSGTKYATGGAMAVSAYGVSDRVTVGFAMAGTASDLNIATQYGDNGHKALDLVGFASYRTGDLNFSAMLGGSYDEADTERAVLAEGFEGRASGKMNGAGYSAAVDAQYNLEIASIEITPRASFRVASFHHGAYEEREMGNLGLLVEGRTLTSLRSSAGINLKRTFGNTDGFRFTPEVGAYYEREFGDRERTANAAFIANPTGSFPIFGEDIDKHRTRLMAGFTAQLNDTVALGVHYEAALGARYDSHRITGGLRVAW